MQKTKGNVHIPPVGAPESELLELKGKWFNDDETFRSTQLEVIAQSLHYTLGNQWIELDNRVAAASGSSYRFKEKDPGARYPKPVTNLVGTSVEVEMSSLSKRELVPNVLTTSKDPRMQAAARVAKDVLNDRLDKMSWQAKRELVTYLTIVTGTGILKSYWDEPVSETTFVANEEAKICPECGTMVSTPEISEAEVIGAGVKNTHLLQPSKNPTPSPEMMYEMNHCPTCDEEVELMPFSDMTRDDAQATDFMGRPMGMSMPKGNTDLEVVSPFDFFPENSGVEVRPDNMRVFGQASVRSVEWICERFPNAEIEPEDSAMLLKQHPILGEYRFYGNTNPGQDANIYGNHARLFELYCEKSYNHPDGRAIVYCNDKVIFDGPLYRTVNGISVPLVKYATARFKVKHGIFWGQGLVENLISPQNRLNGMDSQIIDARERTGSPNLIIPEASGVDGPEYFEDEYGGGKFFRYSTDPLNPGAKPEVIGSILFPQGVWEERNNVKEDMRQIAGPQEIELGDAPKNISTTSGLQILGEQAERRRAARERALLDMFQAVWEHQLRLLWTLRVEDDTYEVQTEEGNWEKQTYNRMSIMGQTRVKIEKQAYVDKSLIIKEGAREAQADGLYQLDSPYSIKKLLELRGLPTDVNKYQNDQVDQAIQQWTEFVDKQKVPYIDPSVDDARIHFQTIGTMLTAPEGKEYTEKVGWPQIVKDLAGWEQDLLQAEALDQQVRAVYGNEMPPDQAAKAYAGKMVEYKNQKQAYDKQVAAGPPPGDPAMMMAAPTPMPPAQPPPPIWLPRAKEDKVLMIWMKALQTKGLSPNPPPPPVDPMTGMPMMDPQTGEPLPPMDPATGQPIQAIPQELMLYLQFRAVVEAYRLLAEEKEMKAMMGVPQTAAPGTPGGSPGTPGQNPGLTSVNPGVEPPAPPATPAQG